MDSEDDECIDLHPHTKKTYQNKTKRLSFKRWANMVDKSVVIINFDGVIGTIMKFPFFSPIAKKSVYMRHGACEILMRLWERYQIVLMSSYDVPTTRRISSFLEQNGVSFDSVYKKHHLALEPNFISYTQVFLDFEVPLESVKARVLVVSPICLENEEIRMR